MDTSDLVYIAKDRIEVVHNREREAVECRYFRAYDEFGVFIPGAVRAGLDFASALEIRNWIVDVADQTDEMSQLDEDWESSEEFYELFRSSTIRNIVLVVAHDTPDLGVAGAQQWADEFAATLGPEFRATATASDEATANFLSG